MPGFDGLKLQEELDKNAASAIDCVHHRARQRSDERRSHEGRRRGLSGEPVNDEALLAAIHRAAERSRALKAARDELLAVKRRYERMTPRERQVFALVATGFLNKQIAFDLGVAKGPSRLIGPA
jgi:FixJ family two-component response regulator